MTQWEYKSFGNKTILADTTLDAIGVEGWELVSVINANNEYLYVFKRRV